MIKIKESRTLSENMSHLFKNINKAFDFNNKNLNTLPAFSLNFVFWNKFIFCKSSKRDPNERVMDMYLIPSSIKRK